MPLSKSDDMGKWVKDFEKSDAPQFSGASKEKRRKMAVAAKLNAEHVADMDDNELLEFITHLPKSLQEEIKEALGLNEKRGLWDNIHAKRNRIKSGSGEKMRKPGSEGSPSTSDLENSQSEEVEVSTSSKYISEATDKLLYLARLGLVNKNEVILLRKALKVKSSGEPISPRYRDIMIKVMDKLIALIINNQQMFNKARRSVQEEVDAIMMFEEVLIESGYENLSENMQEFRKFYSNMKISEQYVNYLNFIS